MLPSSRYSKLYVAIAGAVVQAAIMFLGASSGYTVLLVGLLTALGVYHASNAE